MEKEKMHVAFFLLDTMYMGRRRRSLQRMDGVARMPRTRLLDSMRIPKRSSFWR